VRLWELEPRLGVQACPLSGSTSASVQLDDVPIIFAMLEGPVAEAATGGRPEVALRTLELVFQGIGQRACRAGYCHTG
jgi:hypothetical protein